MLEQVLIAELYAVLEAFEGSEKRAGLGVEVHDGLEEVLGAGVLAKTVVSELDLVVGVVRQLQNLVAEGLTTVEHNLVDFDLVHLAEQLVGQAKSRIHVPVGWHAPYVNTALVVFYLAVLYWDVIVDHFIDTPTYDACVFWL